MLGYDFLKFQFRKSFIRKMIRNKPYSSASDFTFVPPNERGQNGRAGRAGLTSFVLLVGSMTTAVLPSEGAA